MAHTINGDGDVTTRNTTYGTTLIIQCATAVRLVDKILLHVLMATSPAAPPPWASPAPHEFNIVDSACG